MTRLQDIINKAKRRMVAARMVSVTGRILVIAIVIAIAVIAVDRFMNLNLPTLVYIAIVASGAVIGVIAALLRSIDTFSVAVQLDRKLDLRDRLGTAEAIRCGDISNAEFGELITRDAERVVQDLDVKAATPIKFSNDWSAVGLLVIVLGAAIAFVPPLERSSKGQTPREIAEEQEQLQVQQQAIAQTIEDALADVDDEALDEKVRADLDALKKLAEQLSIDAGSVDDLADARNQSAAELDAIAKRLAEQSERNSQTIDSIAERFAGMEQAEAPVKSQEFEEALRNGKFEEAAELLDELMNDAQNMSQAERDAVSNHFRKMSERISEIDDSVIADITDENPDPVGDAMRDLGMDDEAVEELLNANKSEDEIADALEQQGVDEDIARELAEDAKKTQQQQEMQQQADEQSKELADALNEAADEIKQEEPQQEKPQKDSSLNSENKSDSNSDSQSQQQETQEQQSDQSQDKSQKRAAEEDGASQETDSNNENNQQQTESEQDIQANKDDQGQIEEREITDPQIQNSPNNQSSRPDKSNEDSGAKKTLPKQLGEALRELARKQQDAAKGKKASERLREAARKIADSLSEEEKRELVKKWMGKFNDPTDAADALSGPGKDPQGTTDPSTDSTIAQIAEENPDSIIEDVDVTGNDADNKPGGKSIFEWLSDQPIEGDPQRTTQSKQVVRKARSAAEHAVGESTVPKRYHDLIKRYFGKLNDTVEKAAKQTNKTDNTNSKTPTKTTTEDDS